jgi:hypothetical protein
MRLFRGAPVPMTTEGVGETSGLADALGLCAVDDRTRANIERVYFFSRPT